MFECFLVFPGGDDSGGMVAMTPNKTCPVNGCAGVIEYERIMCEKHWFQTPLEKRGPIWEALWAKDVERRAALARELIDLMNRGP
jgi:hypothetical protein